MARFKPIWPEEARVQAFAVQGELHRSDVWEQAAFDVWAALLDESQRAIQAGDLAGLATLRRQLDGLRERWARRDATEDALHGEITNCYEVS